MIFCLWYQLQFHTRGWLTFPLPSLHRGNDVLYAWFCSAVHDDDARGPRACSVRDCGALSASSAGYGNIVPSQRLEYFQSLHISCAPGTSVSMCFCRVFYLFIFFTLSVWYFQGGPHFFSPPKKQNLVFGFQFRCFLLKFCLFCRALSHVLFFISSTFLYTDAQIQCSTQLFFFRWHKFGTDNQPCVRRVSHFCSHSLQ